ncbi:Uncharacterized protein apha_00743 [Umezakia ovalisporum]|jgi:tetratricopeptide (TPR) repeat protein|uniref:hypothetical protein n=1 Tax=Umezakia ovalisporum TaxID=75695 RepID=UPI0006F1096D|nr:Uncharacterized protein apha_00743 [Umezakia ovalisporum]
MSNLEKIVHELLQLILDLKLSLGNSQEIMQQVVAINHIQEQLRNVQQILNQEFRFTKGKNSSIYTLPRLGTIGSLFVTNIYGVNTDSNARVKYITAKFSNPDTEISINDLQLKIDAWIEWGDLLHVISADILGDSKLVGQLNYDHNHTNLPAQVQKVSESLNINLALTRPEILQQQLQDIRNTQAEALQVKEKLNYIFYTIKSNPNLFTILLGVSCFCGQSGFSLEWFDDDQELIISSDNKFHELTDILDECEKLQKTIDHLIAKIHTLTEQGEQSLISFVNLAQETVINHKETIIARLTKEKLFRPAVIIMSSLVVLIFSGWIVKNKVPYFQEIIFSVNQEEIAVANFKAALKLGLEASSLVKNPPHSLMVWEKAEIKWEEAIELLSSIPEGTSVYTPATNRLIRYRLNGIAINKRAMKEKKAQEDFQLAGKLAAEATSFAKNSRQLSSKFKEAKYKWQQAISLLENIPKSTSIYQQAQEILPDYQINYAEVKLMIKNYK